MKTAIDFGAVRASICDAIRVCTGLGQNQVIIWEPANETPVPPMPFFTVQFLRTTRLGWSWHDASGDLHMPASIDVSFNCYATTHEETEALMETWRTSLYGDPTRTALASSGIAMWNMEPLRDLTEELDTGYQPRSYLAVTFGIDAVVADPQGEIDAAIVNGTQVGPVGGSG